VIRVLRRRRVVKLPQTKNVAARGYVAEGGRNETSLRGSAEGDV
jgi:hypothetical protein